MTYLLLGSPPQELAFQARVVRQNSSGLKNKAGDNKLFK